MSKTLETIIALGGKLNPSLTKALSTLNSESKKTAKGMESAFSSTGKKIAAAIGGALSVAAVANFAKQSVDLARQRNLDETKLSAVLKNNVELQKQSPTAYLQANQELQKTADNLSKVGVITSSVTLGGMQQLAAYQLTGDQISKLAPGMADLLAQQKGVNATQEDAVALAKGVGKAIESGQGSSLKRVGVAFSAAELKAFQLGNKIQRTSMITAALQKNVGGVNAAVRNTDEGKIKAAQMAWDGLKRTVGNSLLIVIEKIAPTITDLITQIKDNLLKVLSSPNFTQGINKFVKGVQSAIKTVVQMGKFIAQHWGPIKYTVMGIIGAMVLWKGAVTTLGVIKSAKEMITAYKGIKTAIFGAKAAQEAADKVSLVAKAHTLALAVATKTQLVGSFIAAKAQLIASKIAMVAYKAEQIAVSAVTKIGAAIQWALNIAMAANPVGIIIIAVVALVAVFVLLWTKCKGFRDFFTGMWAAMWGGIKIAINFILKGINAMISGLNSMKVPAWVPGIGGKGINIPLIPYLAKGATITGATLAVLGEAGTETVVPHNNKPRSQSLAMTAARGAGLSMGGRDRKSVV